MTSRMGANLTAGTPVPVAEPADPVTCTDVELVLGWFWGERETSGRLVGMTCSFDRAGAAAPGATSAVAAEVLAPAPPPGRLVTAGARSTRDLP